MSTRDGTEASTCRDDGTTDSISDNEQSFPSSRESQVVEIIEHEKGRVSESNIVNVPW